MPITSEPYSVETDLVKEIALNLKENFKNILEMYPRPEKLEPEVKLRMIAQLNGLIISARNARDFINANIYPGLDKGHQYRAEIFGGLLYLRDNFPETLDNRLLNSVTEKYVYRIEIDPVDEFYESIDN